jgi:DNA invertase Pin-like site-specific DNA recombinase
MTITVRSTHYVVRPIRPLTALGVSSNRSYVDHGLTGTNLARLGLDQTLAAVRGGDTLVVPKLDRLVRSVPDARRT